MNTPGFKNFIAEYNSNGIEKADGYTLSNFDLMTEQEKEKAFLKLSEELEDSSVAADALLYLDDDNAYPLIRSKYINEKKAGRINYHLAALLFKYSSNEEYLEDFISCHETISDLELLSFVSQACSINDEKTTSLLAEIITSPAKQHIRRQAAIGLLERFCIKGEQAAHLLLSLKSNDAGVRQKALKEAFSYTKR